VRTWSSSAAGIAKVGWPTSSLRPLRGCTRSKVVQRPPGGAHRALATPVHAVRLVGDLTGKAVAILGAARLAADPDRVRRAGEPKL